MSTQLSITNRLSGETSPYLISHADNPVHWQPWDRQAFRLARELDRPVFLSIGYSSCHWCHVMEQECFMDSGVAEMMNSAFICIKVDREERPDIDNRYMRYAMAMIGSGGWPLNMVLTPSGEPFFAATYIPRGNRLGRRGLMELIPILDHAWRTERDRIAGSAGGIISSVSPGIPFGRTVQGEPVSDCYRQLASSHDALNGGFGGAPKFPVFHNLLFLLRYWRHQGEKHALKMALGTLSAIRYGGVYDQLGGGIHRYSTDPGWRIPHYEKMLCDQAMLVLTALEAFQASGNELFRRTAGETLDFVLEELQSPSGGFFSSIDADDPGGEGSYYSWSLAELIDVLGQADGLKVASLWNIPGDGEGTPRLSSPGSWIPVPGSGGIPAPEKALMEKLRERRSLRPAPAVDHKILADWNGMMTAALARASLVLNRRDYAEEAKRAMAHITAKMTSSDGLLLHSWKDGSACETGFLDDYAYVIWALIELHSATLERKYLSLAVELQEKQDILFLDRESGLYSFAVPGDPALPETVTVEVHDGAVPSGNSVTLMNLHRLSSLAADSPYGQRAEILTGSLLRAASSSPAHFSMFLAGVLNGPLLSHVTLSGNPAGKDLQPFLEAFRLGYSPDSTLSLDAGDSEPGAVICANGACSPKVTDPRKLFRLLRE